MIIIIACVIFGFVVGAMLVADGFGDGISDKIASLIGIPLICGAIGFGLTWGLTVICLGFLTTNTNVTYNLSNKGTETLIVKDAERDLFCDKNYTYLVDEGDVESITSTNIDSDTVKIKQLKDSSATPTLTITTKEYTGVFKYLFLSTSMCPKAEVKSYVFKIPQN